MSCSFKIGKKISGQYHFVRGHPTVNKSWFTTGLSLTTNGGQTSVTECTSMWVGGGGALYPVIYLQERKFSVPILLRSAFPRSCIKFAFPRARLPKMPGTRERGNAGMQNQESAPISVGFQQNRNHGKIVFSP